MKTSVEPVCVDDLANFALRPMLIEFGLQDLDSLKMFARIKPGQSLQKSLFVRRKPWVIWRGHPSGLLVVQSLTKPRFVS